MNAPAPDEARRARAVLGIAPGASSAQVRQRYLDLVRRWHPDRFATDPRSQAEAEAHMRDINHAYQVLMDHPPGGPPSAGAEAPRTRPSPRPGQRLSREQIDRMVQAIGTDGPLDGLLRQLDTLDRLFDTWAAFVARRHKRTGPGRH